MQRCLQPFHLHEKLLDYPVLHGYYLLKLRDYLLTSETPCRYASMVLLTLQLLERFNVRDNFGNLVFLVFDSKFSTVE